MSKSKMRKADICEVCDLNSVWMCFNLRRRDLKFKSIVEKERKRRDGLWQQQ